MIFWIICLKEELLLMLMREKCHDLTFQMEGVKNDYHGKVFHFIFQFFKIVWLLFIGLMFNESFIYDIFLRFFFFHVLSIKIIIWEKFSNHSVQSALQKSKVSMLTFVFHMRKMIEIWMKTSYYKHTYVLQRSLFIWIIHLWNYKFSQKELKKR